MFVRKIVQFGDRFRVEARKGVVKFHKNERPFL